MTASNTNNNAIDVTSKIATSDKWSERSEKLIRLYRSKIHFISIPAILIASVLHLKLALQYQGECTIQPLLVTYMIVHASITLTFMLLGLIGVISARCIYSRNCSVAHRLVLFCFSAKILVSFFALSWIIFGAVLVISAQLNGVQGSDPTLTATYCVTELYRSAMIFVIINCTVHFIAFVILIIKNPCKRKQLNVHPSVIQA